MSSGWEKTWGKNMIFIERYPNVQHSKIEILAYRTIGVITVNLQHNLPKWVCVVVFFPPIFDIYDSCRVALWRQSAAAVSPRVVKFDFILKFMYCRPHVMVCLNLVHNEAEEEFSLLEMTEAFLFWSVIISDNFSLKYHECFFFVCLGFVFF